MALEIRNVSGKGRGVFTARAVRGGEVVLSEQPLLLFPQHSTAAAFCSHCLRAFNSLGESPRRLGMCPGGSGGGGGPSAASPPSLLASPSLHARPA